MIRALHVAYRKHLHQRAAAAPLAEGLAAALAAHPGLPGLLVRPL